MPHANDVVGVACVQVGSVRAPAERDAVLIAALAGCVDGNLKGLDELLCLQIPNLYSRAGGSAQPVAVGRKHKRVDDVLGLQRVKPLAFVEVPKHGSAVFASRRAKRSVRRNGDSVQVSGVALQVADQLAVVERPNLDEVVPAT